MSDATESLHDGACAGCGQRHPTTDVEYGDGSRMAAEACLEVLHPDEALAAWLRIYLEHTAHLEQERDAALERLEEAERVIQIMRTLSTQKDVRAIAHSYFNQDALAREETPHE